MCNVQHTALERPNGMFLGRSPLDIRNVPNCLSEIKNHARLFLSVVLKKFSLLIQSKTLSTTNLVRHDCISECGEKRIIR